MVRFELKKIFGSWGSKIAIFMLAVSVMFGCWAATNGHGTSWVNEQGDEETGPAAIEQLRSAKRQWAGYLDTEHLTAALRENQRINATAEYRSDDIQQKDIAYGWKQGISDIREVIGNFLSTGFQEYNYYRADSVSESEIPHLYENRVKLLREWLYEEGSTAYYRYSEPEKQWLIEQFEAMESPMYYTYFEGWEQLCENSNTITMLCAMILGYLVAGIFAYEFKWKADAIYFSSMLGRTINTKAKIMAGFLLVTVAYWASILVYTFCTLGYLGFDGWNCPVQLVRWKCCYNVTFLEKYILILLGGYLGNLFSAFLVMWAAAKTKSAVLPVTLPFLLIFIPLFLQDIEESVIVKILALQPQRLLEINSAINYFDVCSIGITVIGAIPVLFVLYLILTAALVPVMYRAFGRKEIL